MVRERERERRVLVRARQHLFGSLRWNGMGWKGECGEKYQVSRYGQVRENFPLQ